MSNRYAAGQRVSEYTLEAPIAAGAFGEVWRARHHLWRDQEVAIKLATSPEFARYLQREGLVVHKLQHPNIVRVIGLDPFADPPYLVMELVRGPSLNTVLNEQRTGLPVDLAVHVLRGVLRATGAAHAAGVLHRDLKPANVMLHLEGRPVALASSDDVRVGDFGLGQGAPDGTMSIEQSLSLQRDAKLVGTLAYLAPEVRDGSRPHDARADLYAIGVMMFELLTGERPAGAELPGSVRAHISSALDGVFSRLYARYDRRFTSASEALDQLTIATAPRPTATSPASLSRAAPPKPAATTTRVRSATRCPKCGHQGAAGAQFCVMCATQLVVQVRRCPKCNGYPGIDDRYCIHCGAALPDFVELRS